MERARSLRAWLGSHSVPAPWRVSPLGVLSQPLLAQWVALVLVLLTIRLGLELPWWGFVAVAIGLGPALRLAGVMAVARAARRWARLASELPFPCLGLEALFARPPGAPLQLLVQVLEPERMPMLFAFARSGGFQLRRRSAGVCELDWCFATWRLPPALRRLARSGAIRSIRLSVPGAGPAPAHAQAGRLPSITSRA